MDYQPDKEITFQRNASEVQLNQDEEASKETVKIPPVDDLHDSTYDSGLNAVLGEDTTSMIQFLVTEIQSLKSQNTELTEQIRKRDVSPPAVHKPRSSRRSDSPPLDHVPRSARRSEHEFSSLPPGYESDDNLSIGSSKLVGFILTDHGRWKFTKAAEQARANFIQQLKDFDISNCEDKWSKFDSTFHTVAESLELQSYVFDPVLPAPISHSEMMRVFGNKDESFMRNRSFLVCTTTCWVGSIAETQNSKVSKSFTRKRSEDLTQLWFCYFLSLHLARLRLALME